MSADQLPPDFAPYHLVRTDLPVAKCHGRYYSKKLVLDDLDLFRERYPDQAWAVLWDGGQLERDTVVKAQPNLRLMRKAA